MKAHVLLHVRELPGGPAVVTPVQFAHLSTEAATVAGAVAALRPKLVDALREIEPVDRLPYASVPVAKLLRIPVSVPRPGKDADTLDIAVGVVMMERVARGQTYLVAYVPMVRRVRASTRRDGDVDRVLARLTKSVAKNLKSWSTEYVLNTDEPEDSRLEIVEIDLES